MTHGKHIQFMPPYKPNYNVRGGYTNNELEYNVTYKDAVLEIKRILCTYPPYKSYSESK